MPAGGYQNAKAAYLQRARFLAIAEFGPRSLIYHEGRAYRVYKARLPPGLRTPEGRLATARLYVCDNCGAAHADEPERCQACGEAMGGAYPIREIVRIDTSRQHPLSASRQTTRSGNARALKFKQYLLGRPARGALTWSTAVANDAGGPVLRIDYASGTLISRVNKGLRRRKKKSILGFGIDPASGRWTKGPDEDDGDTPDVPGPQRVVPIVQDNKNAALFRIVGEPGAPEVMTTLQHALARGLEIVFQLEDGELQRTDPVTR